MFSKMIFATILVAALLAGCATPYTGSQKEGSGPEPTEEQAKEVVMKFLNRSLKDPDSIKQFRIVSGPSQITWFRGLLNGGGHESAWLVCFEYNAKNSYGAYVGVKTDGIAMRRYGDFVSMVDQVNWALADDHC